MGLCWPPTSRRVRDRYLWQETFVDCAYLSGLSKYISVKLPDRIGIVQPLALAVAAGGGGNQATYTRQLSTYQGGGGDYGITQGGKVSVRL